MDIKFYKDLLKSKLKDAVDLLDSNKQIPVIIPASIETFNLSHSIGSYLIVYKGSNFQQREISNQIVQDRDLEFMVVVAARYREDYPPEAYLDYAIKGLSGLALEETNKKIYCTQDEWLGEEGGVWSYAATFVVPGEFWESQ